MQQKSFADPRPHDHKKGRMMEKTIKQIVDYAEGRLREEEAMDLWVHLLAHPEDLKLLEFYLVVKAYFGETDS